MVRGKGIVVSKSDKNAIIEIVKCLLYTGVGIGIGAAVSSSELGIYKWIISLGLLVVLILVAMMINLFFPQSDYSSHTTRTSYSGIDRDLNYKQKSDFSRAKNDLYEQQSVGRISTLNSNSAQISRNSKANALDRGPMSAEKKDIHERNKRPATKLVLLNEEGTPLLSWSLQASTSMIIGKSTDKEPVDVDLSGSAVAQMISKQHAVLNYTERGWFIDDIDSKNGTRVKKITQNSIMDVKLVGAIEVEPGDIIYIANAMLQIQ